MSIIKTSIEEIKASLKNQIDSIVLDDRVECSVVFLKLAGEEDFRKQVNITINKDDELDDE